MLVGPNEFTLVVGDKEVVIVLFKPVEILRDYDFYRILPRVEVDDFVVSSDLLFSLIALGLGDGNGQLVGHGFVFVEFRRVSQDVGESNVQWLHQALPERRYQSACRESRMRVLHREQ